jgi:hypothetical protein
VMVGKRDEGLFLAREPSQLAMAEPLGDFWQAETQLAQPRQRLA